MLIRNAFRAHVGVPKPARKDLFDTGERVGGRAIEREELPGLLEPALLAPLRRLAGERGVPEDVLPDLHVVLHLRLAEQRNREQGSVGLQELPAGLGGARGGEEAERRLFTDGLVVEVRLRVCRRELVPSGGEDPRDVELEREADGGDRFGVHLVEVLVLELLVFVVDVGLCSSSPFCLVRVPVLECLGPVCLDVFYYESADGVNFVFPSQSHDTGHQ